MRADKISLVVFGEMRYNVGKTGTGQVQGREDPDMPQKKWKFNIIDIIAVLLIAAALVFAAVKLLGGRSGRAEMVPMTYQVIAENQPAEMFEAVQRYIPCNIMEYGAPYDAEVIAVEAEHTLVCSNGEWVEDPNHVDLIFTVVCEVEKTPVMLPAVGSQEIRVGREISLKTEYFEFKPSYVINMEYGD